MQATKSISSAARAAGRNSGYIGQLTVTVRSNNQYIVYGPVRGLVSEHRTQSGAERSADKDRRGCSNLPGGNSYSDVSVYRYDTDNGWECIEESSVIYSESYRGNY